MGSYADKLRPKASEAMDSSEQLLGAIRVMPRGATMSAGIGGAVGAVVADRQAKKGSADQTDGALASSWPKGRSAVGLTSQRLLIYDYTFAGKPKDLVAQFGLDQVSSLEVNKGLVNKVRFGFTDGSAVEVECAKLEKVGDFASAFENVKGPSS